MNNPLLSSIPMEKHTKYYMKQAFKTAWSWKKRYSRQKQYKYAAKTLIKTLESIITTHPIAKTTSFLNYKSPNWIKISSKELIKAIKGDQQKARKSRLIERGGWWDSMAHSMMKWTPSTIGAQLGNQRGVGFDWVWTQLDPFIEGLRNTGCWKFCRNSWISQKTPCSILFYPNEFHQLYGTFCAHCPVSDLKPSPTRPALRTLS